MSWNHRVVRKVNPYSGEVYYQIHEAYYWTKKTHKSKKRARKPSAITRDAITFTGSTVKDLKWALEAALRNINTPVLRAEKWLTHFGTETAKRAKDVISSLRESFGYLDSEVIKHVTEHRLTEHESKMVRVLRDNIERDINGIADILVAAAKRTAKSPKPLKKIK